MRPRVRGCRPPGRASSILPVPPLLPVAALVLLALWLSGKAARGGTTVFSAVIVGGSVAALAVLAYVGAPREAARATVARAAPRPRGAPYVTSDACRACHPRQWATWHESFHRTMTQKVGPSARLAPLDRANLEVYGQPVRIVRDGGGWMADLVEPEFVERTARQGIDVRTVADPPRVRRPVVLTTGSHWMQTFWVPGARPGELRNVPVVWVEALDRFLPREAAFLRPPDAEPFHQVWNDNCILCHATAGVPGPTRERTWNTQVAEVGIACEACHGPAEEHVARYRNPLRRLSAHLGGEEDHAVVDPSDLPAARADDVCGQCHSKTWINDVRKFMRQGFAFRPGDRLEDERTLVLPASRPDHPWLAISLEQDPSFVRSFFWPDGTIRVSGRQLNALVESACHREGELSCLSCHVMHGDEPNMQVRPGMDGDGACAECHGDVVAAGTAHTHHPAGGPGSRCMDCHMPYTTFGLLRGLRSHRIDVPTVPAEFRESRPNACTLCHLDRPLAWVRRTLAGTFGLSVPAPTTDPDGRDGAVAGGLRFLYEGDAAQRAVIAYAFGRPEAVRTTGTWFVPHLASLLDDPYAAVRLVAYQSLRAVEGVGLEGVDPVGPPDERRRGIRALVDAWLAGDARRRAEGADAVRLLDAEGRPDAAAVAALLADRDTRPVELKE
ncbi:MAG: hypothetical protein D6705_05570 [Deltaproteobacteria bacterium]|nr:MAG: hypothetical protein D6705_05570 [Deltaproteobacteria bacterium]